MADRIAGYAPEVTVDGDDITWDAGDWRRGIWQEYFSVGDYVANVTQNDTQQITAISGEQSDGSFTVTVSDASGWSTGDRCTLQYDSGAPNQYNTILLADAATAAVGEGILICHSDTNRNPNWSRQNIDMNSNNEVHVFGMVMGLRIAGNTTVLRHGGDLGGNTLNCGGFELYCASTGAQAFYANNIRNGTANIDSISTIGGNYGFFIDTLNPEPTLNIKNCYASNASEEGFYLSGNYCSNITISHCFTAHNFKDGFDINSQDPTVENCIALNNGNADFNGLVSATGYNNADMDGSCADGNWSTGSGNLTSQTVANFDFLSSVTDSFFPAGPNDILTPDSDLYEAGYNSGIAYDFYGNERHATTPSIGPVEGVSIETNADNIIKSAGGNWNDDNLTDQADFTENVKDGIVGGLSWEGAYDNSTDADYVVDTQGGNWSVSNLTGNPDRVLSGYTFGLNDGETGTYDPDFPDVGNVLEDDTVDGSPGTYEACPELGPNGVQYGENGTEFTLAVPTASTPDAPTASVADDETGTSFTVTVSGLSGSDYRVLRYRSVADDTWTTFPASDDQQLGDGSIQVSGLSAAGYEIEAFGRNFGGYGPSSPRMFVTVTDGTTSDPDARKAAELTRIVSASRETGVLYSRNGSGASFDPTAATAVTESFDQYGNLRMSAPRAVTERMASTSSGRYAVTDWYVDLIQGEVATHSVSPKLDDKFKRSATGAIFRVIGVETIYSRAGYRLILRDA